MQTELSRTTGAFPVNSGDIRIRPLEPSDSVTEITALLHAAFAKVPGQPFVYPAASQSAEATSAQIAAGRCWVATVTGRLVGAAIIQAPAKPTLVPSNARDAGAYLAQIVVDPKCQGGGVGSNLLKAAEQEAVQMGAQHMWGSSPVGSRQLALYLRHGYQLVEYVHWEGTPYDSIIFQKRLQGRESFALRVGSKARYFRSYLLYKTGVLENETLLAAGKRLAGTGLWYASKLYVDLKPSSRKDILLCCNDPLMADYLGPFWELFREDSRLRFRLAVIFGVDTKVTEERVAHIDRRLPVQKVNQRWARSRAWDLLVAADHGIGHFMKPSPTLYIGHGPKCKTYGDTEYAYSGNSFDRNGKPRYARMFAETEDDWRRAIERNPVFRDVVTVVGNLENDRVLAQAPRREEFRRNFGFGPDEIVVFVLSTWGDHCLWRTIGDKFLEQARELLAEYRFVLSAHPHEYAIRPEGERIWGEYLRTQRQHGFLIREPSEEWIPYMVATDIVISDYTGLIEYAVLLGKPLILSPVPKELIWQGSVTAKVRDFSPLLNGRSLRECIAVARHSYPFGKLQELAREANPYPGEAAQRIRREVYSLLGLSALQ
jgi:GNAT superfamily N-acetyltransferase